MSEEEMVTIRYLVFCGKPTADGRLREFHYQEQAPASLCVPHVDDGPKPDADATGIFMASLVERYNDEILLSQAWRCVTCDKPAKELLHSAVPLLSPVADRVMAGFVPTVFDNAAPICISGGSCDRAAEKMVHEFAKNALIQEPWQTWDPSKTCDKCGKKSGVKLCGGCKLIAYCSKECQAQSWPSHKRKCKAAQREARENS